MNSPNILNYEIKSLLGEGGMGCVYLAEHSKLGRKVAIKSLHQQLVKNEGLRARFKNEASTMALIQHSKIVTLYDYIEEADGLYLVMEYVSGYPLDEYIKKKSGPIPLDKAMPMMIQILEAFSYAHLKEIVHRDIKPSNILITSNNEIKILDFGIAKLISSSSEKLTKTGTQMGTVYYMSPEQVKGKEIDIRSDIYSLGVTLYQMLTGNSPYEGMTTEYEVYSKILNEPLPLVSNLFPGIPNFIDAAISKATAKNKNDRFKNCEEFSNFLTQNGSQNSTTKVVENNLGETKFQAHKSKNRISIFAISIIAIAVLLGVIVIGFFNKPKETETAFYNENHSKAEEINKESSTPALIEEGTNNMSYEVANTLYERFANAIINQNDNDLLLCFAPTLSVWHSSKNKPREQIISDFKLKYFNKWTVIEDRLINLNAQSRLGEFKYKKKYTISSVSNPDHTIEYEIYGYFVVNSAGQIVEMKDEETNKLNQKQVNSK